MRIFRNTVFYVILTILPVISACSANNAEELFKTAQFEELQNNQEHAAKLYRQIINSYPDNKFAQKAQERLSEIDK